MFRPAPPSRRSRSIPLVLLAAFLAGCSPDRYEGTDIEDLPRPVPVLRLEPIDPSQRLSVTGSLSAWKSEDLGFQVSGRIEKFNFEPGANVAGNTFDEEGRELTKGDVIAELERERYELALEAAIAQERTARAQYLAQKTELEKIVPVRIDAAVASENKLRADFGRVEALFKEGTLTRAQYDKAKADLDVSVADLAEQRANEAVKAAQLEALDARANEAAEAVKQARKDLEDTRLVCPFPGQIADVMQIEGSVASAGQPVVRVQLMDPLKIEVSVSAETDRRTNLGDRVPVHVGGEGVPTDGYVWLKDTVADAATRTFRLTVLLRNRLVVIGLPEDEEGRKRPRTTIVGQLFSESYDRTPPFFAAVTVGHQELYSDSKGHFLWRVVREDEDADDGGGSPDAEDRPNSISEGTYTLEKVRVTPGERRLPFLQVATFRELADLGDFDPQRDLLAGALTGPDGEPLTDFDDVGDRIEVNYVRKRWLLRPGDYVQVDLTGNQFPRGFYVPMDAIVETQSGRHVVAVEEGEGGDVARHVPVTVAEERFLDTFQQVTPVESGALTAGSRIVAHGAYYVVDGEAVSVAREENVRP